MKSLLYASTIAAVLIFTGCGSSEPTVDDSANANSQAEELNIVDENNANDSESGISQNNLDAANNNSTLESLEAKIAPIYFGFDKYTLTDEDIDTIRANTEMVTDVTTANYAVKLEGNCDEWGSDEYNFALGLKRANVVKDEMINDGFPAEKITLVSYGSSSPVCTDKTQECWSKNRRVDFKLQQ